MWELELSGKAHAWFRSLGKRKGGNSEYFGASSKGNFMVGPPSFFGNFQSCPLSSIHPQANVMVEQG